MAIGTLHYQRRDAEPTAVRLDPRLDRLVGREDLIARVHNHLSAATPDGGPALAVLTGMAGVGKTSAAVDYAHRVAARTAIVWQFQAADAATLRVQFGELARLIDPDDVLDRGDPVARVHAALARTPEWLLIIDAAPDPESMREWLPAKGAGQVLITTADGRWAGAIDVEPLAETDAAALLRDRTGQADAESAVALARELGGLPLALAQAADYMRSTGRPLAGYLRLLHADRARLLSHGNATPVTATWSLAVAELTSVNPHAVALLRLMAFLAPERIPIRLILDPDRPLHENIVSTAAGTGPDQPIAAAVVALHDDPFALDDAIAGLLRHSLIGQPTDTVNVHRLVQAATRDGLGEDARRTWSLIAAGLVFAAIPEDPLVRSAWPIYEALLPHARVALSPTSGGHALIASYLDRSGNYAGAREAWTERVATLTAAYGPTDRRTLAIRVNLALAIGRTGDTATARDQLAELLPLWEQLVGPTYPATLTVLSHLARMTDNAGDPRTALQLSERLLQLRMQTLGPEHPDTLNALETVARMTGNVGDTAGARQRYETLVPLTTRVNGPEHPATVAVLANLAFAIDQAGDHATARDRFTELIPLHERVYGPEHPETLALLYNLANSTGSAGDPATAAAMHAKAVPIWERVAGPEHPRTRDARTLAEFWSNQS